MDKCILEKKLESLQKLRHDYCLNTNVIPDDDFSARSNEFVEKWVSTGLEDYNYSDYLLRLTNEARITLLEELLDFENGYIEKIN